ncbi:hypothetical protein EVAR_8376_1 [Eumeta japonica]|uniref:Uncharacterized protein n=1 Tax=Eumeta variegata TaxID=151549 RepID=A0A4C1VCG4_EUMVA|nr:hypothetical protein EVAR_8376_1 [Eumeta japonica]
MATLSERRRVRLRNARESELKAGAAPRAPQSDVSFRHLSGSAPRPPPQPNPTSDGPRETPRSDRKPPSLITGEKLYERRGQTDGPPNDPISVRVRFRNAAREQCEIDHTADAPATLSAPSRPDSRHSQNAQWHVYRRAITKAPAAATVPLSPAVVARRHCAGALRLRWPITPRRAGLSRRRSPGAPSVLYGNPARTCQAARPPSARPDSDENAHPCNELLSCHGYLCKRLSDTRNGRSISSATYATTVREGATPSYYERFNNTDYEVHFAHAPDAGRLWRLRVARG